MSNALTTEEVSKRIKELFKQDVILVGEYKNKRSRVTLHCNNCGHTWSNTAQNVLYFSTKRSQTEKYCPNCDSHVQRVGSILNCSNCGKEIYRTPSELAKSSSGNYYCSQQCLAIYTHRIKDENGRLEDTSNYRRTAFTTYPHECFICKYEEDIRILEVHHIDQNRENNKPENLMILCPNCHRKITLGYYELIKNDDNNWILIPIKLNDDKQNIPDIEGRPTRKELKKMIRNIPFTEVGKKFGVTCNSVRKWCIKYKLPSRRGDIKNITDEEWESI